MKRSFILEVDDEKPGKYQCSLRESESEVPKWAPRNEEILFDIPREMITVAKRFAGGWQRVIDYVFR